MNMERYDGGIVRFRYDKACMTHGRGFPLKVSIILMMFCMLKV